MEEKIKLEIDGYVAWHENLQHWKSLINDTFDIDADICQKKLEYECDFFCRMCKSTPESFGLSEFKIRPVKLLLLDEV